MHLEMRLRSAKLRFVVVALLAASCLLPTGCRVYSFTGASIPSHLQTVAIPLAVDNSINTLTALDEQFTELLLQRFVRQTRLVLETTPEDADALLTTRIERYANTPASVGGQEQATLNRVTISVHVLYRDQTNDTDLLNQSFSAFEVFDPSDPEQGLTGEIDAAAAAMEKIADDIFTAATSNW